MPLSPAIHHDRSGQSPAAEAVADQVKPSADLAPAAERSSRIDLIRSNAGSLGLAAIAAGVTVAAGGSIWAIQVGVPAPIAIMAGYCTLAVSACAALAPQLLKTLASATPMTAVGSKAAPNYSAWKLVRTFSVSDASRLWCEIEPGCPLTQESTAWARALLDAVSRGELAIAERPGPRPQSLERERASAGWHTEVTRDSLRAWAKQHGHNPLFLRD